MDIPWDLILWIIVVPGGFFAIVCILCLVPLGTLSRKHKRDKHAH